MAEKPTYAQWYSLVEIWEMMALINMSYTIPLFKQERIPQLLTRWYSLYKTYTFSKGGVARHMEIKYSVDKVNLISHVRHSDFEPFVSKYLDNFNYEVGFYKYNISSIEYKENTNFKLYRFTWNIQTIDGGSFWLGYRHNAEQYSSCSCYGLKIEYNPNKVRTDKDCILGLLLCNFFIGYDSVGQDVKVKSLDIACDIPKKHCDVIYDIGLKRDIKMYCGTVYMGSGSGRVKVYDKTKEADLDFDLTRYEISLEVDKLISSVDKYYIDVGGLPELFFIDSMDLTIDGFDKAVLYGLQMYPQLLNEFPRRKKEKYKERLKALESFKPNEKVLIDCIVKYFDSLRVSTL